MSARHLLAAHRKNPSSASLCSALGLALLHLKRYTEARAVTLAGLETEPQDVTLLLALGRIEEGLGDKRGAAQAYEAALKIDPTSTYAAGRLMRRDIHTLRWGVAWKRFRAVLAARGLFTKERLAS